MARTSRLDLAGVAQHVIQRGNDRQPCFFTEGDHVRYLQDLRHSALRFDCRIHAYVLMTNHVHLLVTPRLVGAVGRMMQALGRNYVRYFNDSRGRSGTLWEGRFKACLVDSDGYLMECYRYLELNPVRAGLARVPHDYRWSSFRFNGLGLNDPLVTPHPVYEAIAREPEQRRVLYRQLVAQGVRDDRAQEIRLYTQQQRALGSTSFQERIATQLQQRAGLRRPGRPRGGTDTEAQPILIHSDPVFFEPL